MLNTPVARSSRSRGLKAVSPLNSSSETMKFWFRNFWSPPPKTSALPGSLALTPLAVGRRRTSKSVSEIADRFMKMFWPKIG